MGTGNPREEVNKAQTRNELRQMLRSRRRALSVEEQDRGAEGLLSNLTKRNEYQSSQRIALYLACDGEISPELVAKHAWSQGKQCYLPVLDPDDKTHLLFQAYRPDTPLLTNRFNIPEPELNLGDCIQPEELDLVLMPLTGFDESGGRLGMGGGFYDRTFAFVSNGSRPILIGLAHECQKLEKVPMADWDVPVQGVVTGAGCY